MKIFANINMIATLLHATLQAKLQLDYQFMLEMSHNTRGNKYKLVPKLCKYELRKQFFVNRVVKRWNMFKRHLDKFWCDRDLHYDYKSDIQHRNSQCNNSIRKVCVYSRHVGWK